MLAIRDRLLCLVAAAGVLASAAAFAKEPAKPSAKVTFSSVEYLHRWSMNGQNEFTPAAQPDLKTWRDMVTIIVNERVTNGEQLAQLANGVVDNYGKAGQVVRTDSKPRTSNAEAEHFIAAVLQAPGLAEAVFARVVMVEGRGVIVVYSHRDYGPHAVTSTAGWMDRNGEKTERALMSWTGIPKLAQLRALPQAKGK
jgi:hypothetical protein